MSGQAAKMSRDEVRAKIKAVECCAGKSSGSSKPTKSEPKKMK